MSEKGKLIDAIVELDVTVAQLQSHLATVRKDILDGCADADRWEEKARLATKHLDTATATIERLEKEARWEKQVPDTIGAWLRINARGTIEHHVVFESRSGHLTIYWGWSPRHPCRIKDIAHKLEKFQWYGPITLPKGNDQ